MTIMRSILGAAATLALSAAAALAEPALISALAARFGSQCVVIGIDSQQQADGYRVYQYTGDPDKTVAAERATTDWVREVQDRGAGEIVLNCMNQDGVRQGYDTEQLATVRAVCNVPLIASGGAGQMRHFRDVFVRANVDGALAASVFHSAEIDIGNLTQYLASHGIRI